MQITPTISDDRVLLVLEGRLDASWSDTAGAALEQAIRSGRSRIDLDLAAVTFISSVGLGVIVRANARFRSVKGVLAIVSASPGVRDMLRISKLEFLVQEAAATTAPERQLPGSFGRGWNGELEVLAPANARAEVAFVRSGTVMLDAGTIALGHFALAGGEADARGHFGEGLATGGTVAVAPAGAPRPDCLASGDDGESPRQFVRFIARDAIVVRGEPLFRAVFERTPITRLTLRTLASALCDAAGSAVAFTAIGECDGALGAWARVSPDAWERPVPEMNPAELRANLRFSGEPMHAGESMVVVGVACPHAMAPTLPTEVAAHLVDCGPLLLHAHAATVSYRPVPRATRDLRASGALLAEQPLRSVMHCMHLGDDAQLAEETAFVRGSCWAMRIGGAS